MEMESDIHNGYQRLCNFERCICIEENLNAILGRKAGHILNLLNIFQALSSRTVSTHNLLTTFLFTTLFTFLSVRRDLLTYWIHC